MKKSNIIFLILFSFLVLLPFSACKKERTIRIGVSQCSDDDWRSKMNAEILREAMFHDNVEVEIRSADDSNERQIADLNYFADNGFDVIIAAPNESDPITPTVDSIMARNIPVIIFDRTLSNDNYTAFQGADNDSIGAQVAQYVNQIFPGPKNVVEIEGNLASSPARGRHNGFAQEIMKYPDVFLLGSARADWNDEKAALMADSLLELFPDANVIYAHNDRMALAARRIADSLKRRVAVIGVDAAPEIGMKGVKDGKLTASFLYPTEGHHLIKTAIAIANGDKFEKFFVLKAAAVVDKSNADILLLQDEALHEETSKIEDLKSEVDQYWREHRTQKIFLYVLLALLLMLFGLLALFLRAFWQKQYQQKLLLEKNHELEVQRDNERRLNEQLREATQSKLTFFTNVSHDLRTPLTLIAEPVKQLMHAHNLSDTQKTLATLANKNVRILQRLINQILDFRKYESGQLALNLDEVDIRQLIQEWTESFHAVARARHIKLSLDNIPDGDSPFAALDVEKIERVFFNLLSNAFKYSPDNSRIAVSVRIRDEKLLIEVSDTGQGISEEDLPNIFDRFYQAEKVHPTGSGIGLSLAKAFVEMHQGSLSVVSEPGVGSTFSVVIPIRHVANDPVNVESNISQDTIDTELSRIDENEKSLLLKLDHSSEPVADHRERPVVLAIDDNENILILLSQLLKEKYNVISAHNGAEGVRMAAKYVPDLIICDVMMPVMDGLECCRRIKAEVSTSHIPILMLTACSLDEQRVQGYESGADGYVSKPFSSDVLMARIDNLVANRRRILDVYSKQDIRAPRPTADENNPSETSSVIGNTPKKGARLPSGDIDNDFYNRFLDVLRKSLANPDINVDSLASEMGLGRSQFYRKIKALTNFSPVELIRNIRLKEARNLLLTTEMSVSEIAYAVGFSTPAYFTKCYREAFGETPSDTRSNLTN